MDAIREVAKVSIIRRGVIVIRVLFRSAIDMLGGLFV